MGALAKVANNRRRPTPPQRARQSAPPPGKMGAAESVPNPDARTLKAMELIDIGAGELALFWRHFRKADKEMLGSIEIDAFYALFDSKRSIFGDGIFEINGIAHGATIDFGEYLTAVVMYCLFEPPEILRFCMYIFDRDKNGFIEKEELLLMLRVLYHVTPPDDLSGTVSAALDAMAFHPDGRVDFEELREFHTRFPNLLYPAFRLQLMMITETMGQRWWDRKKRYLHTEKVRKKMIDEVSIRKEHTRLVKLREKRVRKKMGILRYFCCPHLRKGYRTLFPIDDADALRKKTAGHIEMEERKKDEIARRISELASKPAPTRGWAAYQAKKARLEYTAEIKRKRAQKEGKADGGNGAGGADRKPRSMTDRERRMAKRRARKIAQAGAP